MCESLSACRLYFPGYRSSSCRDRFFSPIPEPLLSVSFFGKLLFSISHSITPGEGSDILIFTKDRVDALVPCLKAFSMSVMKSNGAILYPRHKPVGIFTSTWTWRASLNRMSSM